MAKSSSSDMAPRPGIVKTNSQMLVRVVLSVLRRKVVLRTCSPVILIRMVSGDFIPHSTRNRGGFRELLLDVLGLGGEPLGSLRRVPMLRHRSRYSVLNVE